MGNPLRTIRNVAAFHRVIWGLDLFEFLFREKPFETSIDPLIDRVHPRVVYKNMNLKRNELKEEIRKFDRIHKAIVRYQSMPAGDFIWHTSKKVLKNPERKYAVEFVENNTLKEGITRTVLETLGLPEKFHSSGSYITTLRNTKDNLYWVHSSVPSNFPLVRGYVDVVGERN